MLFNSIPFAVFAAVLLALWPLLRRRRRVRLLSLTIASLVFYGYHGGSRWPSLVYILCAGLIVWRCALGLRKGQPGRRLWFGVGLAATIGVLAVFKYAGLVAVLANAALAELGLGVRLPEQYPIPLALSFISFQLASYLIDVHRGQLAPAREPLHFFAFVTFFPKLIAGPVVRGSVLLGQLDAGAAATAEQRWQGVRRFVIGLFKKSVIADQLVQIVGRGFGIEPSGACGYWWAMAIIYTAQSYADFSGYSDMAIGLGKLLGIDIPENFAHPFNAAGFREFWLRWHISVSTWFRDYLFFPLAKGWLPRLAPSQRPLALHGIIWLVMLLSGVWHGTPAGYAIWGALNALYLSVEMLTAWPTRLSRTRAGHVVAVLITVLLWALSQVIFRAASLEAAWRIVTVMFSFDGWGLSDLVPDVREGGDLLWPLLLIAVVVDHAWAALLGPRGLRGRRADAVRRLADTLEPVGIALLLVASIYLRGPEVEFIYFKF